MIEICLTCRAQRIVPRFKGATVEEMKADRTTAIVNMCERCKIMGPPLHFWHADDEEEEYEDVFYASETRQKNPR